MPFELGNTLGKNGRPGYEIEEEQKQKMQRALDRDLALLERVQNNEASDYDQKIFPATQARVLKYLDKLHVSKSATDITTGGKELNAVLVKFVNGEDNRDTK